jgi:hypothetical protein
VAEKKSIQFQGRTVLGESVDFEATSPEAWNAYKLVDGSTLKVKLVLLNVVRLDEHAQDGNPVYQFQAQQIVAIDVPEMLKRKDAPKGEKRVQ